MSATAVAAIKAAILALTDESTRKKIGWVLVAILSPIILVVALICSIFSSTSQHNVSTVELCFHGGTISASATPEYRQFILEMRESFSMLDSMVEEIEADLQNSLQREVPSSKIGELVMEKLKSVDEVAYVRFASVYRQFKDIDTFMKELNKLLESK